MNKYKITARDRWLLERHPIDPVTQEPFKVGDKVVICASCKTVHYSSTWGMNPQKPCSVCEGNTPTDFNLLLSGAFKRNGSSVLRSRDGNDQDVLNNTFAELQQLQADYQQKQTELQQTQNNLHRTQRDLSWLRTDLQRKSSSLDQTQSELQYARDRGFKLKAVTVIMVLAPLFSIY